MTAFAERPIVVYDMPLKKGGTILRPESTVLRLVGVGTVDMGALCYLDRSQQQRHPSRPARLVKPESFHKARIRRVRDLIRYVSDAARNGSQRPATLMRSVRNWLLFIDWCDDNDYSGVLDDESVTRVACRAYFHHLTDRVQCGSLASNTAGHYQSGALDLARNVLGIEDIDVGMRLIRRSDRYVQATSVPDEQAQSRVLSLCYSLFTGLSDLAIDKRPYPYRLSMPAYLGWEENHLWLYPGIWSFMTPHHLSRRDTLHNPIWAFDFARGRMATVNEVKHYFNFASHARRAISHAERQIAAANADAWHYRRKQAAARAHNAFVLLFVAQTGMNWSQVSELRWSDDFDVGVERQGFREIKYRSANKTVSFQIEARFLREFRRFLQLREYLLQGTKGLSTLFVSLGPTTKSTPTKIGDGLLDNLYQILRHIDPTLTKVMPRSWRAAKSDWLIRHADLSTAALMLQSSEKTVARSYATGSESRAIEEVSQFFDRVSRSVRRSRGRRSPRSTDSALGKCQGYGNPIPEMGAPIEPDCHQAESCLFCDRYAVHADRCDVRKLLSCRYCIGKTSHLSASREHFDSIYNAVFQRIDQLLTHISDLSKEHHAMVKKVRQEVDEDGELDPYWARKLDMLIQLGAVRA
jgi:integrase